MNIGLFVPCFIDQLHPPAAIATLRLLEHYGHSVAYPESQVCCGQPVINAGQSDIAEYAARFETSFEQYDAIVCPSPSCVATIRHLYPQLTSRCAAVVEKTYELCEFLVDKLAVASVPGRCGDRIAVHQSCHGLRELRLGPASELLGEHLPQPTDRLKQLLGMIPDVQLVTPARPDECCGFGGMFSVVEETVSCLSGNARLKACLDVKADIVTATDWSCLMHLQGLAQRQKLPLRFQHAAEILAGDLP